MQFLTAFMDALRPARLEPLFERSVDSFRFPHLRRGSMRWAKLAVLGTMARVAWRAGIEFRTTGEADATVSELADILHYADGLGRTYDLLSDDRSRECLINLLALRVRQRWVRARRNTPEYWRLVRALEARSRIRRACSIVTESPARNEYDLSTAGFPIRFEANAMHVANTFGVEQYRYIGDGFELAAQPGDVVIDGGGCWGDTALYFAHRVGSRGKVYCFEFDPYNLAVLARNLGRNAGLSGRVQVIDRALWDRSDEQLRFSGLGPCTSIARAADHEAGEQVARTVAIDDLAASASLGRVDFIKLDIEGAELSALQGARQTIRDHRPTLAIAVYHDLEDLVRLPEYLDAMGLGYRFYLDHYTVHREEAILFARPA